MAPVLSHPTVMPKENRKASLPRQLNADWD
jgi:hypothetical protein